MDRQNSCPICLEEVLTGESLTCGHRCHRVCMTRWLVSRPIIRHKCLLCFGPMQWKEISPAYPQNTRSIPMRDPRPVTNTTKNTRIRGEIRELQEFSRDAVFIESVTQLPDNNIECIIRNTTHNTENLVIRFEFNDNYPFEPFVARITNHANFRNKGLVSPFDGIISLPGFEWFASLSIKNWIAEFWDEICAGIY